MAVLTVEQRWRRQFLTIIAAGFALRLVWVLAVPVRPVSDSAAYAQLAWSLASQNTYAWANGDLTAYWPVGTAFIYSLGLRVFGHSLAPLAGINLVAATLSLALLMLVARRVASDRSALIAGAIYAVWPSQVEFTSVLASELLFNLFLLLSFWVALAAPIRSWIIRGLLAGVVLAAASYVGPTALPLALLLAAALIWRCRADWRGIVEFTVSAFVAMAICIAPWKFRNERELGAPVLISTNGPANTWMGNNPHATGAYMDLPAEVSGMNEVQRSQLLGQRAKAFVFHHPSRAAVLFARKLVITHDRETIGVTWNEESLTSAFGHKGINALKAASTLYWWVALLLGISGACIVVARQRWRSLIHPAVLTWAYFAFVHAATVAADRYHFPSIPFVALLGGIVIAAATKRVETSIAGNCVTAEQHRFGENMVSPKKSGGV